LSGIVGEIFADAGEVGLMSSGSFIVHADRDDESDGRIKVACSLATRFDARLIGVAAAMMDLPVIDPMGYAPIDADVIATERDILEGDLSVAAERFGRLTEGGSAKTEFRSSLEFPADLLCRQARCADLLIIGRGEVEKSTGPQRVLDPGDVLMQAGRPVLVVPPGVEKLALNHVVIAWKDTRECRRAVADALPFLEAAHSVSVIDLCTEDELEQSSGAIADVVAFLGRHGIAAEGKAIALCRSDPVNQIIEFAKTRGADLIVAGAYGHARLREWVFGGVTYELIKRSPICCLLSH
jgi:nucleotide-binding universal stress UspA family protein